MWEKTHSTIHHQLQQMDKVRNETSELIHQRVDEMVQLIRQEGEELLGEVDQQLHQDHQYFEEKLQLVDRMVKRMTSSERLVEKMNLFASDQEVMDMHPFIRESLEELKKETLPAIGVQIQKNFTGVQEKLQALYRRVRGRRGEMLPNHLWTILSIGVVAGLLASQWGEIIQIFGPVFLPVWDHFCGERRSV